MLLSPPLLVIRMPYFYEHYTTFPQNCQYTAGEREKPVPCGTGFFC